MHTMADEPDTRFVSQVPQKSDVPKHLGLRLGVYVVIGFIFFGIILLVCGWYFVYMYTTAMGDQNPVTLLSTAFKSTATAPTPKESPWSTYTNAQEQYSVGYPSTWSAELDDTTLILYPPGSTAYANLTIDDIGAGLGPKLLITVITRPFVVPDSAHSKFTTDNGIVGYAYNATNESTLPTIDFPLHNKSEILEFSVQNIGQEIIDQHLRAHNSQLIVKDIDETTYESIVTSLHFFTK